MVECDERAHAAAVDVVAAAVVGDDAGADGVEEEGYCMHHLYLVAVRYHFSLV
eukprot:m.15929 g.15929  ORF g.15929 m.15929 type:complete len:53 (-) comp4546_c0_seq1:166-324(-)